MQTEIKRWGNSGAVRLTSKILAAAHLDINSPISIEVKGHRIIIEPLSENKTKKLKLPFSETELIDGLNPENSHADELDFIKSTEFDD